MVQCNNKISKKYSPGTGIHTDPLTLTVHVVDYTLTVSMGIWILATPDSLARKEG